METATLQIPGYRIEKSLGKGAMSTVYLAVQESLDRRIALKILSPQLANDPTFNKRFIKEGRIIDLSHAAADAIGVTLSPVTISVVA